MRKILITIFLFFSCLINAQEKISTTVHFVVDTDTIIENDEGYRELKDIILPYVSENKDRVEKVILSGSASPEGNIRRNRFLANIRCDKIYKYFSKIVSKDIIEINNDYNFFLYKTNGYNKNYREQRATYIEVLLKEDIKQIDTVYVNNVYEKIDTVYLPKVKAKKKIEHGKFFVSLKTDLLQDVLLRPSIGIDLNSGWFGLTFFADCSFSWWKFSNFDYKIISLNAGIKKYFNNYYDGFYLETFGKYTDYILGLNSNNIGNGFGAGLGIGYTFKNTSNLKFSIYCRGGWISYVDEKSGYTDKYSVISTDGVTVIAPSVVNIDRKNYFGLFNIGIVMSYNFINKNN